MEGNTTFLIKGIIQRFVGCRNENRCIERSEGMEHDTMILVYYQIIDV